jgi:methylglutaconyl-CoA hydratase
LESQQALTKHGKTRAPAFSECKEVFVSTIIVKEENGILNITLNRPEIHNAFDPEMIGELTHIFSDQNFSVKSRAVILKGAGESFCAGADLNWMKSMMKYNFEENLADAQRLFTMFDVMKNCPVPVIGKIHGNVFGGGLGLVAICDIVAAEEKTKFCFSEAKLGLVPSVISPFVRRKMAPHILRELFLTADVFTSEKAMSAGLVHFTGSNSKCDKFVEEKIGSIRKCGKGALITTKKLLNDLENIDHKDIKLETASVISRRRVSEEGQEGLKSFLEKRKPNWISEEKK